MQFVLFSITGGDNSKHHDGKRARSTVRPAKTGYVELFLARFALHTQLFQGRRKGQAQRAPDNMESGGGGAVR